MKFEELVENLRFLEVHNLSYEQLKKIEKPLKNKLYLVQRHIELEEERRDEN